MSPPAKLEWLRAAVKGGPKRPAYVVDGTGCWVWQGAKNSDGYGTRSWRGRMERAHRVFYGEMVGPVPENLTLDHLCRNRACVNPSHLEPVTNRENILRGVGPSATTFRTNRCKRGHSDWGSRKVRGEVVRRCRACDRIQRIAEQPKDRERKRRSYVPRPRVRPIQQ